MNEEPQQMDPMDVVRWSVQEEQREKRESRDRFIRTLAKTVSITAVFGALAFTIQPVSDGILTTLLIFLATWFAASYD
jgi:hypothetical protein